ncbi:hypothetical protein HWV62_21160 [Athelia sp. TMB]|nr:hypothetical protein HWV62_21160 [Athelia sp. TMB]
MHALLVAPLFASAPASGASRPAFSIRIRALYSLVTLAALLLRLRTIATALAVIPSDMQSMRNVAIIAWRVLHSHPAQSSIGWDVIWTTISFFAWNAIGHTDAGEASDPILGFKTLSLFTETVVASAGVSAPDYWRKQEGHADLKED